MDNYFDLFDSDRVIERMMNGPNWPNPKYINKFTKKPNTPEEIKEKWKSIGEYSRNRGTWMHYNIERYFNGLAYSNNITEMDMFLSFKREYLDQQGITPLRTEWKIADKGYSHPNFIKFLQN